jgi:hypothetical protein
MGMTKAALDLQIQTETQKAIAILQKNMMNLDKILQIIDGNMRQSHLGLFQDITQLRVRVNFLMGELKNGMTEEGVLGLEERFKEFAKGEAAKMDADISKAIREREEKAEAAKFSEAGGPGNENTPNVIQ